MDVLTATPTSDWSAGQVIEAKYIILDKTGEDAIASVYRTRTVEGGQPRELRVLKAELARDPLVAREFRQVGNLVQKLGRAASGPVEAVGESDGRPFLVTEPAEGRTLEELIAAEAPLDPARACAIVRQIASALEAGHRLGLLHLGLEPRQIMVSGAAGEERVRVQGFGTAQIRMSRARSGSGSRRLKLEDLMPEAPDYCAPEVALARSPDLLDGRADLYSLGVIMVRMLTGHLPATTADAEGVDAGGDALATLAAQVETPASNLSELKRQLPEPIAGLVLRLLEKRPELRPSTARGVAEALDLAGRPIGRSLERGPAHEARQAPPKPIRVAVADPRPVAAAAADPKSENVASVPATTVPAATPGASAPAPVPEPSVPEPDPLAADVVLTSRFPAPLPSPVPGRAPDPVLDREQPAVTEVPPAGPMRLGSPSSVLFKTGTPPPPAEWGRRALAALAVVLIGAAALFFIGESKKLQWGSLTPTTVDEQHSLSKPDTSTPNDGTEPTPSQPIQPGQAVPPGAQPQAGSSSPSLQSPQSPQVPLVQPGQPALQGSGNPAVGGQTAPAAGAPSGAQPAGRLGGSPPAVSSRAAKPGSGSDQLAAEVRHAISAGDVFYQLGQYGLAIQTYQGPLQLDPNNKVLRNRIERARKAEAAEQQFLGQP